MNLVLLKSRAFIFLLGFMSYIGQEYLFQNTDSILQLVPFIIMLLSMCLSFVSINREDSHRNPSYVTLSRKYILLWKAVVILSCVAHGILNSFEFEAFSYKDTFSYIIVAVGLIGLFTGLGLELSIYPWPVKRSSNLRGVFASARNSFSLVVLFIVLAVLNYAANRMNAVLDLTYFKVAAPSEMTLELVKKIPSNVEVASFFSRDSEVEPYVRDYFEKLKWVGKKSFIRYYDKHFDLEPVERFNVSRNGQIVFMLGSKRERISLGDNLLRARGRLKNLDKLVQKSILAITSRKRNIYFTSGHGEMLRVNRNNPLRSLGNLGKVLREFNYNIRTLSTQMILEKGIPSEADLIMIVAPTTEFMQREVDELEKYFRERNGRLLVLYDIDSAGSQKPVVKIQNTSPLEEFIKGLGIEFVRSFLANDKKHIQNSRKKSDRYFIFTNNFSKHISVSNLKLSEHRMGLMILNSGYLKKSSMIPKNRRVFPTIKSIPSTFVDMNRNYSFDPKSEVRGSYPIAMVTQSKNNRLLVFSDASFLADPMIYNPGNQLAIIDAIKWMLDKDSANSESSEIDIKILHSKSRERIIFYGSIFIIPILTLIFGVFATRSRTA